MVFLLFNVFVFFNFMILLRSKLNSFSKCLLLDKFVLNLYLAIHIVLYKYIFFVKSNELNEKDTQYSIKDIFLKF